MTTTTLPADRPQWDDLTAALRPLRGVVAALAGPVSSVTWALSLGFAHRDRRAALVAGFTATAYVRGGHTPPEEVDALVLDLLAGRPHGWSRSLRPAERAQVAAAAIEGHVQHQPGLVPAALTWHRLVGSTALVVSRG